MLHYNPRHVSSSTMLIFRRTNCIITASGIVTLCKRPYSTPVESGLSPLSTGHKNIKLSSHFLVQMDGKTHFSTDALQPVYKQPRKITQCLLCYTVYEYRQACLYGTNIKLIASYLTLRLPD